MEVNAATQEFRRSSGARRHLCLRPPSTSTPAVYVYAHRPQQQTVKNRCLERADLEQVLREAGIRKNSSSKHARNEDGDQRNHHNVENSAHILSAKRAQYRSESIQEIEQPRANRNINPSGDLSPEPSSLGYEHMQDSYHGIFRSRIKVVLLCHYTKRKFAILSQIFMTSLWHRLQLIDPSSNILLILRPTLRLQILHPSLCFPHPPLRPGIQLVPIPVS